MPDACEMATGPHAPGKTAWPPRGAFSWMRSPDGTDSAAVKEAAGAARPLSLARLRDDYMEQGGMVMGPPLSARSCVGRATMDEAMVWLHRRHCARVRRTTILDEATDGCGGRCRGRGCGTVAGPLAQASAAPAASASFFCHRFCCCSFCRCCQLLLLQLFLLQPLLLLQPPDAAAHCCCSFGCFSSDSCSLLQLLLQCLLPQLLLS